MIQAQEQGLVEQLVAHATVDGVDGSCTQHRCAIVAAV
jgi:hypothetical protein